MWTEVHELSALLKEGKYTFEELNLDDVNVRLKWAGLFHRSKRAKGTFMMRLKVCHNVMTGNVCAWSGRNGLLCCMVARKPLTEGYKCGKLVYVAVCIAGTDVYVAMWQVPSQDLRAEPRLACCTGSQRRAVIGAIASPC